MRSHRYVCMQIFLGPEFKQKAKDHDFQIGWQTRYQFLFMVV